MQQWRSRHSDPDEMAVLHSGVPTWMKRPLLQWVRQLVRLRGYLDVELLQEFETSTRAVYSNIDVLSKGGVEGLFGALAEDDFLDFVDFLVFYTQRLPEDGSRRDSLDRLLRDAGSEWTVGVRNGHPSLEKRVPEGVSIAAADVMANCGTAGEILAEAWRSAFGRTPDPEDAYGKAIKAVEEAGAELVSPLNKSATLGTMIRDMGSQGDWRLEISEKPDIPVELARSLWKSQPGRHGGNDYRKPNQSEAEAAIFLAMPLVQWFSSGAFRRATQSM